MRFGWGACPACGSASQYFVRKTKPLESADAIARDVEAGAAFRPGSSTLDDFRSESALSQRSAEREPPNSATNDQNAVRRRHRYPQRNIRSDGPSSLSSGERRPTKCPDFVRVETRLRCGVRSGSPRGSLCSARQNYAPRSHLGDCGLCLGRLRFSEKPLTQTELALVG